MRSQAAEAPEKGKEKGSAMNLQINPVDIVVPVYNGYEDLVLCTDSLRRHTDLSLHRVLLIDDRSPDERIRPLLEALAKEQGFEAVFNERNQGFSANVNLGLARSGRDTILLNSDTIVTRDWVEKLQRCAYRSDRIATVTPLSNAATLASVPVAFRDNRLPEGFTVDSYGDLVERVSLHRYPRVTVAVGFCMYVKQQACAEAGLFDAETFGRGYGEENDFCNRCAQLGYIHVLCDDTFIYHRGTGSFDTEEKKRLLEEHTRILKERYPDQMKENDLYSASNPDQELRDNLNLYAALANGRPNLLYVLHLDFKETAETNIGGTQLHVRDLKDGMLQDYNVFVLARDGDFLCLTAYTGKSAVSGGAEFSFRFPAKEELFPVMRDREQADFLRKILKIFEISLVHVHHTQGLTLDIFHVCREMKIPVIATLHDYYYACPTIKLLRDDEKFCPSAGTFSPADPKRCRSCLRANCGFCNVDVISRWREECLKALSLCAGIVFPTASARDYMLQVYPSLKEKSMVIGHGSDYQKESGTALLKGSGKGSGRAVVRTGKMHSCLDRQPGGASGFHYVVGWAYLEDVDSRDTSIVLVITDKNRKAHYMQAERTARTDVAKAVANPLYLWSGIHTVFDLPDFPDGSYALRILIRHDGVYYTDGRVYRGICRRAPERFSVGFLGGVTRAKGSALINSMICSGNRNYNFYVFGEVGDDDVSGDGSTDHVFFSGLYRREDIGTLLRAAKIDLVVIPPIWAETFCYTLSEAWACGIPVIGTDIGAVGERIRETGAGWLLPPDAGPDQLTELLDRIRTNPELLKEKKEKTKALRLKSVARMDQEYLELYGKLRMTEAPPQSGKTGREPVSGEERDFIFQAYAQANPGVTGRGHVAEANRLREENSMLRSSLEMLKNTTSYRFARKISEADIPFKEPLKRLFKKR